jgi:hypothetical protein
MVRKNGTAEVYRIVVRSELNDKYASAFEGMQMEAKNGRTILTGEVEDQPHLFGILERLNALGLVLLSVQALPGDAHSSAPRGSRSKSHENRDPSHLPVEAYSPECVE